MNNPQLIGVLGVAVVSYVMLGCWVAIHQRPRDDAEALLDVMGWPFRGAALDVFTFDGNGLQFEKVNVDHTGATSTILETMPKFILRNTGGRPVKFDGRLIAEVNKEWRTGRYDRWFEMRLYRTESGKFVVEIIYRSNAASRDKTKREEEDHFALVGDNEDEVLEKLEGFDEQASFPGMPPGPRNAREKEEEIRRALEDSFDEAMGKLLQVASEEFPDFAEEV